MKLSIPALKINLNDIVFQYQYHQVVRYIVSFLVSVIMVRSALPTVDLGTYELLIFVVISISGFWSNGIKNAFISYYNYPDEISNRNLPWTVFLILSGIAGLLSMMLIIFPGILSFFGTVNLEKYVPVIGVYLFFIAGIPLIETIFLLEKKSNLLWQYTYWSQSGIIILSVLAALFRPELDVFIFILIFWAFIRWCYLILFVLRPYKFCFDYKQFYVFGIFAVPLILNMITGSAMDMIDGLFIAHYFEPDFFPVFRYGAREMPLASLLFSSLSLAMIPLLTEDMKHISILKEKTTRHLHLLAPLSILLMIAAPYLFTLVYGTEYKVSAFIFNIYLLIMVSRVMLPQTICLAKHQHSIIVWSGITEVLANIILSYWWLRYWGVYGLAAGTIVAYAIQKAILIIYNNKVNGISIAQYIDLKAYLIYTFLLILTFIATFIFNDSLIGYL